jgi:hypothetical protein
MHIVPFRSSGGKYTCAHMARKTYRLSPDSPDSLKQRKEAGAADQSAYGLLILPAAILASLRILEAHFPRSSSQHDPALPPTSRESADVNFTT